MDGHLPALRVRLGDQLAADGACQEALLHAHQLRHPLHGGGQLLPQAEELVPVDGGPVGVHRGDLNTRGGRGVGLVGSNRIYIYKNVGIFMCVPSIYTLFTIILLIEEMDPPLVCVLLTYFFIYFEYIYTK